MDILFIVALECAKDILAMVEQDVGDQTAEDSKPESIAQGKGHRKKDRAVFAILGFVNDTARIQNSARIVDVASIVVRIRSGQREVCSEPCVGVV